MRVPLVAQYSQHKDRPVQVERRPEPPKLREDVLQRRPGPQSRDIRKVACLSGFLIVVLFNVVVHFSLNDF